MAIPEIITEHVPQTVMGTFILVLGGLLGQILKNKSTIDSNTQKILTFELDESSTIRKELKTRCDKLELENGNWQKMYYQETTELKLRLNSLESKMAALNSQLDDLKGRMGIHPAKDPFA